MRPKTRSNLARSSSTTISSREETVPFAPKRERCTRRAFGARSLGCLARILEDATMVRVTSRAELKRAVAHTHASHLIYYGHMVGPYTARRISPAGTLRTRPTAAALAAWLPDEVKSVDVLGCKSESFAQDLAYEKPDLLIKTVASTQNLFDWVDPSDRSHVLVWLGTGDVWPGLPSARKATALVTYPRGTW